jgi:hypothetical protein
VTNNHYIVDGSDGESTLQHKEIRVRGYFFDKIEELVEENGWEYAASKVCGYCGGYIQCKDETVDFTDYICQCDEEDRSPQNSEAPI